MKPFRTLSAAVVCGALLSGAVPAAAAPPGAAGVDFTVPSTKDEGLDGFCAFPVRFEGFNNQQLRPNGRVTGAAVVTATNVETGKTIRYNVSGPGVTVTAEDGSFRFDGTGPQLAFTTVRNSFPGVSPLSYTRGRVFFEVDAKGLTTAYGAVGKVVDVCAALS